MPQSGEQVSWFLSCRFRTVRRVRFAPAACMRVRRALHHRQSCRRKTAILPASTWNGWHQCQNRPEPRVLESCFAKLPHGGFVRGSKPFFALDGNGTDLRVLLNCLQPILNYGFPVSSDYLGETLANPALIRRSLCQLGTNLLH